MQPLIPSDPPQPATPPQAQPLPLGSMLEYSQPSASDTRPGIITAIGVVSIVVACLSGLANLLSASSGLAMMMTRMPAPAVTVPAPAGPAAPATAAAPATPATPAAPAPAAGAMATTTYSVTVTSATTVTTTVGPGAAPMFLGFDTTPAILSLVTSALGLALALLLFVAGIFMLRASRYAARLHWWFVLLKVPLVIVATAITVWMWSGIMKAMFASMPAPAPGMPAAAPMQSWMMHISTYIGALLALAYPLALIFVLRSRRVRDYFDAVHA